MEQTHRHGIIDVSGTSNTSSTLIAGGNFLRTDAADTTTGALTVDTDLRNYNR